MHPVTLDLASDHIRQMRAEAAADRLANTVSDAHRRTRSPWRRTLGGGARRLSGTFADIACRLDPASFRPSYGRE